MMGAFPECARMDEWGGWGWEGGLSGEAQVAPPLGLLDFPKGGSAQ